MNKYAKIIIHNLNNEFSTVRIQRYGRIILPLYGEYRAITQSSWNRLQRIIALMHNYSEPAWRGSLNHYEWQPTSPKYYYQCLECKSIVLSDDPWLNIACYECDKYDGMPMRLVEKHNVK